MGYKLREILFSYRKIVRKEEKKGNLKKTVISFFLSLAFTACYYIGPYFGGVDQLLLQKTFYYLRGKIDPPKDLVMINIDDDTYKKLKLSDKKPFPRRIFAEAFYRIQEDKPKLAILDLMATPSPDEEEGTRIAVEALKLSPATVAKIMLPDIDGVERSVNDPRISAAAALEVPMYARLYDRFNSLPIISQIFKGSKTSRDEEVPLLLPLKKFVNPDLKKPNPNDLINYYGPPGTIRSYSLWEFFSEENVFPQGFFKDKIVVIGTKSEIRERANTNKEIFQTSYPVKNDMYGVEIHANIAGNLLEQNWIKTLPQEYEPCLLIVLSCVLFFFLTTSNPMSGLIFGISYLAIWFFISYLAFVKFLYFIPGFFMLFLFSPFIFGGAACITATQSLKELRETKKMLGLK